MKHLSRRVALGLLGLLMLAAPHAKASAKNSLQNVKIVLDETQFVYNGSAHTPSVSVSYRGASLREGVDYTLRYEKNIDAGKGSALLEGIGAYQGKARKDFTIHKAENLLHSTDFELDYSAEPRAFSLAVEQSGEAKLSYASGHTSAKVDKAGNVTIGGGFVGRATITVTAPATKNHKAAKCKITILANPEKTDLMRLFSGRRGEAELSWEEAQGCSGYEIALSDSDDFSQARTIAVRQKKTTSYILSGESGGRMFIRIRSIYAKDGKTLAASDWSAAQALDIPLAVVLLASDYQNNENVHPKYVLPVILAGVDNARIHPDEIVMLGDYAIEVAGKGTSSIENIWEFGEIVEQWLEGVDAKRHVHYILGNHDRATSGFLKDGLRDMGSYLLYVLNTPTANPWNQGAAYPESLQVIEHAAKTMRATLNQLADAGEHRPILVLTHVPLHFSNWTADGGDNLFSRKLFEVLSQAGERLTILFAFGHNHGSHGDSSIGGSCICLLPGEEILIPDPTMDEVRQTRHYTRERLTFTYMNAGYIGYTADPVDDPHQSVSIVQICEDRLRLMRYGWLGNEESGPVDLSREGKRTSSLWPEGYLSQRRQSAQVLYEKR